MSKSVGLRAKEAYWTATRAVGLGWTHQYTPSYVTRLVKARIAQRKAEYAPSVMMALPDRLRRDEPRKSLFNILYKEYLRDYVPPADPVRIIQLMNLMESVSQFPEGDYIELGVQRGHTARAIFKLMPPRHCKLYLLDTYEKNFEKTDLEVETKRFGFAMAQDFPDTSAEGVFRFVTGGWPTDRVETIAGWFPQSFAGLEQKRWRFVHIDFDLYEPIRAALEILWPSVVDGGVVLVHDYGCLGYPGVKTAVDDFADKIGIRPVMLADSMGSALFIKPAASRMVAAAA